MTRHELTSLWLD